MNRIRRSLAAATALAVASGIALLPALTSATPAAAAVSCNGTSLVLGVNVSTHVIGHVRVPTVGNGSGNWVCELGLGNDSVAVARLQIALDDCNLHARLTVDSDYGPLTQAAVVAVQKHYGVAQDGIYGPVTGFAMTWPYQGGGCGSIIFNES
ncbi:MAG TPA: peptidoglycan-binding domain-containing protein [Streptosporangiaceae bacterium]